MFKFGRKYKNRYEVLSEQFEELSRLSRELGIVVTTARQPIRTQRPDGFVDMMIGSSSGIHPTHASMWVRRTNTDPIIIDHLNQIV